MISNPFYLLSILISPLFAFFSTAYAIETLIRVFRIKKHRTRSMWKLLPFISLLVDVLFSQFSIAKWINPLSCASCLQKIFLETFFPQLKAHLTEHQISLVNHLGVSYNHSLFSIIFIALGLISLIFAVNVLFQSFLTLYSLRTIIRKGCIYTNTISNELLNKKLKKRKIDIYLSDKIQVPLTAYPNIIVIPQKTFAILPQLEFEAIIAHECEHLKYHDPLTRLLSYLIAALFWWIPTQGWMKNIEYEQELACDQSVAKYGISADSIASALVKVAKQVKNSHAVCYFTSPEHPTLARVQSVLGFCNKCHDSLIGLNFCGVCAGLFLLLLCLIYV